jgi:tetratricopeptide (TPR) repeat protein
VNRRTRFALMLLIALLAGAMVLQSVVVAHAFPAANTSGIHDFLVAGYVDKAIQSAQGEIAKSPNDAEAHYFLGRAYYSLKEWDRSISELEKSASLDPRRSLYQLWLGRAYGEKASDVSFLSAMGWAKKTRQAFERAVQLDPKNLDARSDLTEFYMNAPGFLGGGTDKVNEQIQKIAAENEARALQFRARMAEKDKNYTEAEQDFRKALTASGNQTSYWLDLASYYRRRSRWNDMEKAIQTAVDSATGKPGALFEAAEILHRSGRNLNSAADLLRKYLSSDKKDEEAPAFRAHYLLGSILEQQHHPDEAAAQYRAALEMAREYQPAREALKRIGK